MRHDAALIHSPREWEVALASVLHFVTPDEVEAGLSNAVAFEVDANDIGQVRSARRRQQPVLPEALGQAAHCVVAVTSSLSRRIMRMDRTSEIRGHVYASSIEASDVAMRASQTHSLYGPARPLMTGVASDVPKFLRKVAAAMDRAHLPPNYPKSGHVPAPPALFSSGTIAGIRPPRCSWSAASSRGLL